MGPPNPSGCQHKLKHEPTKPTVQEEGVEVIITFDNQLVNPNDSYYRGVVSQAITNPLNTSSSFFQCAKTVSPRDVLSFPQPPFPTPPPVHMNVIDINCVGRKDSKDSSFYSIRAYTARKLVGTLRNLFPDLLHGS